MGIDEVLVMLEGAGFCDTECQDLSSQMIPGFRNYCRRQFKQEKRRWFQFLITSHLLYWLYQTNRLRFFLITGHKKGRGVSKLNP